MLTFFQAWKYARESVPGAVVVPIVPESVESCLKEASEIAAAYTLLRGQSTIPDISVVLPVHFKEPVQRLYRCIKSLTSCVGAPSTEIIAVLNGKVSTHELESSKLYELCSVIGIRTFIISYIDIELYHNIKRPQNIFVPKQIGLNNAEGAVVLHADVDCCFSSSWVSSYAMLFAKNPDLLAAYGPVYYDPGAHGWVAKSMTVLSALVKATKILCRFPPFAGHNHAIRKSVRELVPNLYGSLKKDCQILVSQILRAKGVDSKLNDFVRYAPGALVSTIFPKKTDSIVAALHWVVEAGVRNVKNYILHRRNKSNGL